MKKRFFFAFIVFVFLSVTFWLFWKEAATHERIELKILMHRAPRTEIQGAYVLGVGAKSDDPCSQLVPRLRLSCLEGRAFSKTLDILEKSPDLLQASNFEGPPFIQTGGGTAVAVFNLGSIDKVLKLSLSDLQKNYLIDGWGYGVAFNRGLAEAERACHNEASASLLKYCLWGVGRATFFADLIPGGEHAFADNPAIVGGALFASVFSGENDDTANASARQNIVIAEAQIARGSRAPTESEVPLVGCLATRHFLDCASP